MTQKKVHVWIGAVIGPLKLFLTVAGLVLAAAIFTDLKIYSLSHVDGSQAEMLLAALLVYAGR